MAQRGTFAFQGCNLAWRVDGTGPPLVMIQGVGACGTSPNPQIERLSARYTCLSLDNRGIGESQPAARELSAEQMAADVSALMEHLEWEPAHVVGHSFGGVVAALLASAHKTRVRSLTLLCSFARGEDAYHLSPRLVWILMRMKWGSRRIRRNAFMDLVLPPGHPEMYSAAMAKKLADILGHDLADTPAIAAEQTRAMRRSDAGPRLAELAGIPTLVINGGQDMIAPPALGRALAAAIPGARFIEIEGGAHSLPVIDPDQCANLVLAHLAAHSGSAI